VKTQLIFTGAAKKKHRIPVSSTPVPAKIGPDRVSDNWSAYPARRPAG
jgi:hypothetical protein